ncbi:unnamed protein product [Aureobasidium mustum]|uniref:Uncharacterized protein n=1 Tax=Aureobasidium mustum TaxID=2773714 RepID=A0A9N8K131_9PEZI|nr:unnamed protein product [Aureobasidium mustum]
MEPWQSWAVALIGAAAVYYYYFQHGKPVANRTRSASVSDFVAPQPKAARRRESTKPKPKSEATKATGVTLPELSVQSGDDSTTKVSDGSKKRKAGKKQTTTPAPSLTPAPAPKRQELDDDVAQEEDNKAWAQQLASLKKGTSLAPPARTDSRNKTVKQSSKTFSSASSNAADADDDLTPSMSPSLAAGDVSDMLEPASAGPSVLRLTGSDKPTKANQPRQSQAQEQETKKQRQNRKKVEERRLQREAEEKERQVLLETQRRTVREARGEPAKNGVPVPPTSSAWAADVAKRATQPPAVAVTGESAPLLDTFDQSASTGASEEDQLRLAKQISQDDSGWNTVPKGKKQQKKKAPVVGSEDSNTSDAGSVVNAPIEKAAPLPKVTAPAPKVAASSTNGFSSLYDSGYDAGSHPDDSQWAA